jgi:diguanylate cyclase (GGDEF)-like protein
LAPRLFELAKLDDMTAPAILLLSDDPQRVRQWSEMLSSTPARLFRSFAEIASDAPLDVIVTDRLIAPEAAGAHNRQVARGEIAVVAVGSTTPADVSLPSNFTPRELRLACLLLTEIVRLRRERRENARARKVLSHLAMSDPLTGLANRRCWEEDLARRRRTAESDRGSLCIAIFDLDLFKRVNDASGHAVGDEVLRAVAKRLAASVRSGDVTARLGGDEFGVLLGDLAADGAPAVIERIRESLRAAPTPDCPFEITASAGFVIVPEGPADRRLPDEASLYAAASGALQQAKREGRNRAVRGEISGPT